MIGEKLGSYRIVGEIGAGGMGEVYRAEHTLLGKPAAVKRLKPEYSGNEELVTRLFNEARATTLIHHPGIVEVFDFGFADDGAAFIIMELLEGESLLERLERRWRLPDGEASRIARQIAGALAAAHDAGIIHRDLKPDNVMLVPDDEVPGGERVKILDFGIAKLTEVPGPGKGLTKTGLVMGTPYYMSPEQCAGEGGIDQRSDVYALGCVIYLMVCGRPPFDAGGSGAILGKHLYEEPQPPRAAAGFSAKSESAGAAAAVLPGVELEACILKCLRKSPDERFQSMRALVAALDACQEGGTPDEAPAPGVTPAVGTVAEAERPAGQLAARSTIGGATGELIESMRAGRGRLLWLGGAAAVAIAATAFVLFAGRHHTEAPGPATAAAPATLPEAPDAAVKEDASSRPASSPPDDSSPPDAAPPSSAAGSSPAAPAAKPASAAHAKVRTGGNAGSKSRRPLRRGHRHSHAAHRRGSRSSPANLDQMFEKSSHGRSWGKTGNPFDKQNH